MLIAVTVIESEQPNSPDVTRRTSVGWPAITIAVLTVCTVAASLVLGINFDVRYAFGGLRVSSGTGSILSIFIHRPLAYRALIALFDVIPRAVFPAHATSVEAEAVMRLEADVITALVCLLVWAGLRRHVPTRQAVVLPVTLWIALSLAGPWSFLEPDWVGTVWAVAMIGAALAIPNTWLATPAAGAFAVLATATKVSTAPYALIALGVVWLLDRRRGWMAAAWSAGLVLVWAGATAVFEPTEWQWLHDMSALTSTTVFHVGITGLDWSGFAHSLANLVITAPVIVALPAAAIILVTRARARTAMAAAVIVAVACTVVPVLAQAEWYLYQWIGLPVLAAGLAVAASRDRGTLTAVGVPVAVGGVASAVLLTRSVAWRDTHLTPVTAGYVAIALAGVLIALLVVRGADRASGPNEGTTHGRSIFAVTTIAMTVAFAAANLPDAGYSFADLHADYTNAGLYWQAAARRAEFGRLRDQIGPSTPVLYLTFGDIDYLIGNPTDCRYASPVWLQRSTTQLYVREFPSYQDNLRCVTDTDARYVVLQPAWLDPHALAPDVAARLDALFDCTRAIPADSGDILVCPRR